MSSLRWAIVGVLAGAVAAQAAIVSVTATGSLNNANPPAAQAVQQVIWGTQVTTSPPTSSPVGIYPFNVGAKAIADRNTTILAASFDESGRLLNGGVPNGTFPSYLVGGEQVISNQANRTLTDLTITITTNTASYAYLLLDNRSNGTTTATADSEYDDPDLTGTLQWVGDNGWTRMETGLSPLKYGNPQGDYVGIDEGNNGSLNQFYAIYRKRTLNNMVSTYSLGQGVNMYSIVVVPVPEPASLGLMLVGGCATLIRRRRSR